jgi:4-hydroxybenzoate polyprenyltransferase
MSSLPHSSPPRNKNLALPAGASSPAISTSALVRNHLQLLRVDHWVKNVFVLPGLVVALYADPSIAASLRAVDLVLGMLALCLVASSNYVLNEVLDAPYDRLHPTKHQRPAALGQIDVPMAYVQWILLMAAGMLLSLRFSTGFTVSLGALWVMGCIYNIPPLRSKDLPYLDVLSEAVNNPLRMLIGWYLTGTLAVPSASLLISYWMIGCYFMAIKRFAEYREAGDQSWIAQYRKSFQFYSERRLLVSIMFYGSHAMLFLGAFIMRYRLEWIIAFPLVALVMAIYLSMAFKQDSAAQRPEGLYREPALMAAVVVCAAAMLVLLFVDVKFVHQIFVPTLPTAGG